MSLRELLSLNPGIQNPNRIYIGQTIIVGTKTAEVSAAEADRLNAEKTADYVIRRGDNLYRIARANHTTVARLLALNPWIRRPNLIFPGQILKLPE